MDNELRIGNWLKINGRTQQVVDCMCDSVNTKFHQGIPFDMIEPIPLTEDWLFKLGFEFDSKDSFTDIMYYEKKYDSKLNKISGEITISVDSCGLVQLSDNNIKWVDICKIKYVHQLQNLYFALTGEELEVKQFKTQNNETDNTQNTKQQGR